MLKRLIKHGSFSLISSLFIIMPLSAAVTGSTPPNVSALVNNNPAPTKPEIEHKGVERKGSRLAIQHLELVRF